MAKVLIFQRDIPMQKTTYYVRPYKDKHVRVLPIGICRKCDFPKTVKVFMSEL